MIFVSVGTYPVTFNRLLEIVDLCIERGYIKDDVVTQSGYCTYVPRHQTNIPFLDKKKFDKQMSEADAIISHAGMGTISLALQYKKPILIMPRLKWKGEMVNDHQLTTARVFGERGHVLSAFSNEEFFEKVQHLKAFTPRERNANTAGVADHILRFIKSI